MTDHQEPRTTDPDRDRDTSPPDEPFGHERVLILDGPRSALPIIVAVHSTALGQAVGGVRLWRYGHWTEGLADAMRLSRAMTLKCSLAGLDLGGGKSVIALPVGSSLDHERRRGAMLDLGDAIESLGGSYGGGEDVGTTAEDMAVIRTRTRHVYGLPTTSGGSGEPAAPTADGVFASLLATAEHVFGTPDLAGRRVAIAGLGQVGARIAKRLASLGAELTVTDIEPAKRRLALRLGATWVDVEDLWHTPVDLLVPAALGGVLTPGRVAELRCAAVVGPANNQLADESVADLLAERGIVWAPDFLVNAGGVISSAHLDIGHGDASTAAAAVAAIGDTLRDVFARAARDRVTPFAAAQHLALGRVSAARRQLPRPLPDTPTHPEG